MSVGVKQLRQLTTVLIASPPGLNDDALQNYMVGSTVYSISDQTFYECSDNTPGAAVWGAVSFGGGGVINSGSQYRIPFYSTNPTGTTLSESAAITANRALISDANGVPTHSATTNTQVGYLQGISAPAIGDTFYFDGTNIVKLAAGTANYILQANGAAAPSWVAKVDSSILSNTAGATTVAAGATEYAALFGGPTADSVTEANVASIITEPGVISNFYIRTLNAQPGTGSYVLTVRVNGVDTGIVITIASGAAAGIFSDTVNTATVAAGDLVSIKLVNNASGASAQRTSASATFTRS